jgi:long-chain acyl-CoA synthetase
VLQDGWDSGAVLRLIHRHGISTTAMVPTMFHRLLQLPDAVREASPCRSLIRVFHAAAPCPIETKRRMLEWWGPILDEYYASTEAGGTSITAEEWLQKPGSVGRPYPGAEIRILDSAGNRCPPKTPGRVYMGLRGPFEYFRDPVKTESQRIGNFVTVGDIGYLDEDGYLFLVDRESDTIISGGVNIYPAEIEEVLLQRPEVEDCRGWGA